MTVARQLDCLPRWRVRPAMLAATDYQHHDAVLQIIGDSQGAAPFAKLFAATAKKRGNSTAPPLITADNGTTVIKLRWEKNATAFTQLEELRRCLQPLADAVSVAVDIRLPIAASHSVFAALAVLARLPGDSRRRCRLLFAGCDKAVAQDAALKAAANTLARALCRLPPNILTVPVFTRIAATLGRQHGLTVTSYNAKQLATLGAGAILAVGRSSAAPPCIVRLRYTTTAKAPRIVLVGKGVCYDTGGVNIKPARYMRGMKGDMAGAAAALAAIIAAAQQKLPVNIDAFLALADNGIGPHAYRPDEEITALNGKRIEIVHSDAEGRMLLADTLTLATRTPTAAAAVISFATLTGTMHIALGSRMSGVFATDDKWRQKAMAAADSSGERLCAFPMPGDYKKALKSDVADIKQCAEQGEADHIMAALFLREFIVGAPPWLHLDLSAATCKGGLGAAPGPETGFGTVWALQLLQLAAQP